MKWQDITIYEDPRKGSVKRVQNLKNQWYIRNLPLEKMNQTMSVSDAIRECLNKDPELLYKFTEFQEDVEDVQEIMLATVLTYDDVKALEDELTVGEFDDLVCTCRGATGGIIDFFDESGSDMSLKTPNRKKTENSMSSPGQHGGSSAESTEHSTEKQTNSLN